jgi:Fanconi anemia group M protein
MPFLDIFSKKSAKPEIKPKIIADNREKNSLVIANLIELGAEVEFKQLEVADYLIGNTSIERKSYSDFISSMLSKRLLEQLLHMQQCEKRLLIIEQQLEEQKAKINIHPNAIKGMLLAISLEMQTPIIQTKDEKETAEFLFVLAKKQPGAFSFHARKPKSTKQQQQYILESFQGIGPQTAKKLLEYFKTIKAVINASKEQLGELIGKKAEIFNLVSKEYRR